MNSPPHHLDRNRCLWINISSISFIILSIWDIRQSCYNVAFHLRNPQIIAFRGYGSTMATWYPLVILRFLLLLLFQNLQDEVNNSNKCPFCKSASPHTSINLTTNIITFHLQSSLFVYHPRFKKRKLDSSCLLNLLLVFLHCEWSTMC